MMLYELVGMTVTEATTALLEMGEPFDFFLFEDGTVLSLMVEGADLMVEGDVVTEMVSTED